MFDYVVSGGCSFAWGDELKDRDQRYSSIIAQQENAQLFDFSGAGYSNEAIELNLIKGIVELIKTKQIVPEKTLALIGLTYATRLSYYSSEAKGWFSTFPHRAIEKNARYRCIRKQSVFEDYLHFQEIKTFYNDHTDPLCLMYSLCTRIHRIQTFLKLHNIRFVFTCICDDTLELIRSATKDLDILFENNYSTEGFTNFKPLLEDIDHTKIFNVAFENFTFSNKYPIGIGLHPLEEAHMGYAKILRKFIDEKFVS